MIRSVSFQSVLKVKLWAKVLRKLTFNKQFPLAVGKHTKLCNCSFSKADDLLKLKMFRSVFGIFHSFLDNFLCICNTFLSQVLYYLLLYFCSLPALVVV